MESSSFDTEPTNEGRSAPALGVASRAVAAPDSGHLAPPVTIDIKGETLTVCALAEPGEDVRRLVDECTWGSSGGLQYRNLSTDWSRMENAVIVSAQNARGESVACLIFIQAPWGYYVSSAIARPGYRRQRLVSGLFYYAATRLHGFLGPDQSVVALVVADNTASLRVGQVLQRTPQFRIEALLYSRRWPRASSRCRPLRESEREEVLGHLDGLGRSLQDAAQTMRTEECLVLERDGKPVAGVQVCPQRWHLLSLGDEPGRFGLRGVPLLLGGSLENMGFLQLHHLWGDARCLRELFSHCLRAHGACLASIQLDPQDPLYPAVRAAQSGLAAKLIGVQSMLVYAYPRDIPRPMSVAPVMGTIS